MFGLLLHRSRTIAWWRGMGAARRIGRRLRANRDGQAILRCAIRGAPI